MISIIVPVYNSEKSLRRCIDSILAQTCQELQVILVEDGSKDNSKQICEEYAERDSRVLFVHKANEGVSMARNKGIELAKGSYIQFVDSDDYIAPDMCEKMLHAVEKSGADLAVCGFHHLYAGRDIVRVPKEPEICLKSGFSVSFLRMYEAGFINMPWNKLFRAEKVKEGFKKGLSLGEDLLFNLSYLRRIEKLAVVKEPFYFYIQEKNQNTLSSKRREDKLQIAEKICEETKSFYRELSGAEDGFEVIEARFVKEALDDILNLPFDLKSRKKEKLELIEKYMSYPYLKQINKRLPLGQLDYQIVNFFLQREKKHVVYALIYLRKAVVKLLGR